MLFLWNGFNFGTLIYPVRKQENLLHTYLLIKIIYYVWRNYETSH